MTILSAVQEAATELGMNVPTQLFGAPSRDMVEMRAVVKEVTRDIAEAHDWQILQTIKTITGDAVAEAFDLPDDYDRMLKTASLWSSRWLWAIHHVVDSDEWIERQVIPFSTANGEWTMFGGQLHVLPIMATGETLKFFYISKLIVKPAAGTNKAEFTADTDTFRLSERLLTRAIIAQWKKKKGQPYAQAMDDYVSLRADLADKDGGSKPVVSGQRPASWRGRKIAWPGTVTNAP